MGESRLVTTWYLEMRSPAAFKPSPIPRAPHVLKRLTSTDAELVRALYATIGAELHWTERLGWSGPRWQAHLAQPAVQLLALELEGETVGSAELQGALDGDLKLTYLGLLAERRGRGWGGRLLSAALELSWSLRATRRIWLHTCSLDDAAALANYRARGFSTYAKKLETVELTRPARPRSSAEELPNHA